MKRKSRKIVLGMFLITCLILTSTCFVFAEEGSADAVGVQSITAEMYTNSTDGKDFETQPRLTIKGDGGSCILDYGELGGNIHWSVHPATILPYTFAGTLKIYNSKMTKLYRTYNLLEAGVGSEGNTITIQGLGLRNGYNYKAKLSGSAITATGFYEVSDNAVLPFTY